MQIPHAVGVLGVEGMAYGSRLGAHAYQAAVGPCVLRSAWRFVC